MGLKLLAVPVTFALAVPIGLLNGLELVEALLVAAWFTVLVVAVLPLSRTVVLEAAGGVLLLMLVWGPRVIPWGPRPDAAEISGWTGVWLVGLFAVGVSVLLTWLAERRKKKSENATVGVS